MTIAQQHASPALPHHQMLSVRVRQLAHALEGFPVLDLVETYAAEIARPAPSAEGVNSFLLTHACLANWQSALDLAIDAFPAHSDASQQRVKAKQERAREALAHVRAMLISVERQRTRTQ